ncbi:hypothetical protein QFZ43_002039 [Streptomyces afghaniensis]|nr:hypothetical protein [Streptomyces afghaniensis]
MVHPNQAVPGSAGRGGSSGCRCSPSADAAGRAYRDTDERLSSCAQMLWEILRTGARPRSGPSLSA